MAEKLYEYFSKAGEIGGLVARTRLSILTKLTSVEAKSIPDTSEKIAMLEEHFATIVKEFSNKPKNESTAVVDTSEGLVDKLRKHIRVFSELTAQRSVYQKNMQETFKRITEALVDAVVVERASIWLYNKERNAIECADLYVRSERKHTSGVLLKASDFPAYFKSIDTERTISAHNAHTDPRTAEFSSSYLTQLGINSMLDVPIWSQGKMVGVICHEHVGPSRKWTTDEETFAYLLGNVVGMTMENLSE